MTPESADNDNDDPTEALDAEFWDAAWGDATVAYDRLETIISRIQTVLDADDIFDAGHTLEEHATHDEVEAFRSLTNAHSELEGAALGYLKAAAEEDDE